MSNRDTRLLDGLRSTLQELENNAGVSPSDSALMALRSILMRRIADLQAEHDAASDAEQTTD